MAHKVLSKDMFELVAAMRLAQQYSETTLDAEYRKSMLSAAHVLAMDAKNLLDVVDSIRIRFPSLVVTAASQQPKQLHSPSLPTSPVQKQPPSQQTTSSAMLVSSNNSVAATVPSNQQPQHHSFDLQQSAGVGSAGDCYQNLQPKQIFHSHSSPPSSLTHSYEGNTSQQPQQQQQLYSNHHQSSQQQQQPQGIYDNDCIISQQQLDKPKKPLIAAKPPSAALASKLKPFQPISTGACGDDLLNEPLKIVEDPADLYCNTTAVATTTMATSSSSGAIKLPEPVSCTIVQENLLAANSQKIMANKLG